VGVWAGKFEEPLTQVLDHELPPSVLCSMSTSQ
jgi:hypothetical protein